MKQKKNSEKFKENSERLQGGEDCSFRVIRIIFIRKVKSEQRHEGMKELAMGVSRRSHSWNGDHSVPGMFQK